ncbi:MAG TPA: noncanonical pyrimidine nucleotidase, YjjG family [Chloroflexi bacterium]|nr:noncanonical pyrimidine nucleotidase, YjjG family [Chloroflexota bacterium]
MSYQWLLLDADGTVLDYDSAEAAALEKAFTQAGHPYRPAYRQVYRQINGEMWQLYERGELSPDEVKVRRFQHLFAEIDVVIDPHVFSRIYLAHLAEEAEFIPGARALLETLHGQIGMVIITNGLGDVQRRRFSKSGVEKYVMDVVISDEVGASKPDSRIFDVAFERMGNPRREEVLIVGDSLTSDIGGGSAYGIDTCWYNPVGRERPADAAICYEIKALSELEAILTGKGRGSTE